MDDKLYDMMDWARIEGLIYSEEDQPHDILGAHMTDEGVLIQTFLPTAESILVRDTETGKTYPMQMEDETGFFAALIPGQKIPDYRLVVTYDDGSSEEFADPYAFQPQITEKDMIRFTAGICYDIYDKLGAHPMTLNGVEGVYFAVWAPNALRVSVVGDFNLWDGRRLPMRRLPQAGIFELFVPGIKAGSLYKYEIKARGGLTFLKADPFANAAQLRPETASVVADIRGFEWTDEKWQKEKQNADIQHSPMSVYEVHLGAWKKPDDGRLFYNYRELAPMLADYILTMGYTHLELLPVMEHPLDESLGYQTSGYFAPTSRYGTPQDFMYFMNYMHEKGISVILDWAPAHFPADDFCLKGFDGTCLYEHMDPRQGRNEKYGTLVYNYGRAEVRNFLIASALFWARVYHADGIRVDGVSAMLYLDYGKSDGQWVANMYGGNENLEAIEFIKHMNSIFKKTEPGTFMIAQEDSLWPKVTAPVEEDGLGFDLKWNEGWVSDFTGYMELDPIFRGRHHSELTLSMIYHYSENYLLPFSHKEVMYGKGSMFLKMPGRRKNRFANLRAAYGFQVMHPGKQLLFMGQDAGMRSEFSVGEALPWNLAEEEDNATISSIDSLGYNGRLYVLIDSRSASASAFLAGAVKRNDRGYVVGRETMSAYHCETCIKFANISLTNSQFTATIPMVRVVIDETVSDRLPALRGVIPDCDIPMTEAEFHYDGDYILDRTLQLIAEGTYLEIPDAEASLRKKALIFAPVAIGAVALLFLFFRIRSKQRNATCSPN